MRAGAATGRAAWTRVLPPVLVFGALLALPAGTSAQWLLNIGVFTLIYAGLASAWNLVGGIAGYPSLGHAAFFGIGAYLDAIWYSRHPSGNGYLPFLTLPLIAVPVAVLGFAIGWVVMRTRKDVFAIVTITMLFVVQTLAYNLRSITGGSQGIGMPVPHFDANSYNQPFYYVAVVLLLVAVATNWLALSSKWGLALRALRADEERARGVGVHTDTAKLLAFAVSVGITAMLGALWGYYVPFIYPQFAVDPLITIGMVLMAYLGGRGTVWGPVLGAFIVVPAQQYLAYRLGGAQLYLIGYAAVFLVIMLLLPRGILPTLAERRRRSRAGASVRPAEEALSETSLTVGPTTSEQVIAP